MSNIVGRSNDEALPPKQHLEMWTIIRKKLSFLIYPPYRGKKNLYVQNGKDDPSFFSSTNHCNHKYTPKYFWTNLLDLLNWLLPSRVILYLIHRIPALSKFGG